MTEKQSLELCLSTWPDGIAAITHYSDSKRIYEDSSSKDLAHTDWIYGNVETYDGNHDIEFEVKQKDLALLRYIKKNNFY
jgi:UV DNA damage repair endonuclease